MHLLHELEDENNTTQPDVEQKLNWSEKVDEDPVMRGVNVKQCSGKARCFNLTSENVRRKAWRFLNRSNSSKGAKVTPVLRSVLFAQYYIGIDWFKVILNKRANY